MSTIGQPERETQNRVIAFFHDEIGYRDRKSDKDPGFSIRNRGFSRFFWSTRATG